MRVEPMSDCLFIAIEKELRRLHDAGMLSARAKKILIKWEIRLHIKYRYKTVKQLRWHAANENFKTYSQFRQSGTYLHGEDHYLQQFLRAFRDYQQINNPDDTFRHMPFIQEKFVALSCNLNESLAKNDADLTLRPDQRRDMKDDLIDSIDSELALFWEKNYPQYFETLAGAKATNNPLALWGAEPELAALMTPLGLCAEVSKPNSTLQHIVGADTNARPLLHLKHLPGHWVQAKPRFDKTFTFNPKHARAAQKKPALQPQKRIVKKIELKNPAPAPIKIRANTQKPVATSSNNRPTTRVKRQPAPQKPQPTKKLAPKIQPKPRPKKTPSPINAPSKLIKKSSLPSHAHIINALKTRPKPTPTKRPAPIEQHKLHAPIPKHTQPNAGITSNFARMLMPYARTPMVHHVIKSAVNQWEKKPQHHAQVQNNISMILSSNAIQKNHKGLQIAFDRELARQLTASPTDTTLSAFGKTLNKANNIISRFGLFSKSCGAQARHAQTAGRLHPPISLY
jgi:hypothetical protein